MNEVAPLLTRQKEERKQGEPEAPGDFFVDEKNHQILLSESGHQKAEEILARIGMLPQGASLYEPAYINLVQDRKSTRLNSSHITISYAVFCLKKKKPGSLANGLHTKTTRLNS